MYELPTTVLIGNQEFKIRNNADYRLVLDVIESLEDPELTPEERGVVALILFYDGIDSIEDIFTKIPDIKQAQDELYKFIACSEDMGCKTDRKLIDWQQDEQLIVSAVNNVARTEIRALNYLHWWTFLSYFMAVGESSLSTVVAIRDKLNRGKKLEKYEQDFKNKNPHYFVWKKDLQESKNVLESIWNKGY